MATDLLLGFSGGLLAGLFCLYVGYKIGFSRGTKYMADVEELWKSMLASNARNLQKCQKELDDCRAQRN